MRGFSLIELMMVLMIAGVFSVMGFEGKFFWQKTQAEVLQSQLFNAISLTRSEAIVHHDKIILCGSLDQATCSDQWQSGYIIKTDNEIIYHFQNLSVKGKLYWRSFPDNKQQLEFMPDGLPNSENGTFWFCCVDAVEPVWAIILNKSGRPRVVYPDSDGNIKDSKGKSLVCLTPTFS